MDYKIREIKKHEYPILSDFLYEAIFIPKGMDRPPKSIIEQPELQVYVEDFGKEDDWCLVAEIKEKIVGAAWVRIMDDYGHIDDETPSFAISLYEEYRNMGIGTALMRDMLEFLTRKGYKQASLSVQKANDAVRMYQKVGFEVIDENEEEYIMVCRLSCDGNVQMAGKFLPY
ncbi:MAG: GNAT family N-acetyltransferase [Eubacterium sp.]|nr:GNAT family N-acetyltransferase [Eubacterium sp.]